MTREMSESEQHVDALRGFWWLLAFVLLLWSAAGITVWFTFPDPATRGQFGDMFGAVNALFSGLAMGGVVFAILLQRRELSLQRQELRLQREELRKTSASNLRQVHMELLRMSMSDKDLADVWLHSPEESELHFKQSLYINLILSHWEMLFSQGIVGESELNGILSSHMGKARFQEFWSKACEDRKRLAVDKDEAAQRFVFLVDNAFAQSNPASNNALHTDAPQAARR